MRIAIVGVGAIGGALAGLLDEVASHELSLCTRRPTAQLTVTSLEGARIVKGKIVIPPEKPKAVDFVIVATKTYDAEGAAAWFPSLCADGAPLAVVQNGVEHRERFQGVIPAERLLPVVIDCPVERLGDGEVRVRGEANMKVEDGPLAQTFAGLFAGTRAAIEVVPDFTTAAWSKLCINAAGVLCALAQKTHLRALGRSHEPPGPGNCG